LELSGTIFEVVKSLVKFGASQETTKANSYNLKFTTTSNPLGSSTVSFYNNAVNNISNQLAPRKYTTGSVEFSIIPIRVQW
jgi:hypothetical protein